MFATLQPLGCGRPRIHMVGARNVTCQHAPIADCKDLSSSANHGQDVIFAPSYPPCAEVCCPCLIQLLHTSQCSTLKFRADELLRIAHCARASYLPVHQSSPHGCPVCGRKQPAVQCTGCARAACFECNPTLPVLVQRSHPFEPHGCDKCAPADHILVHKCNSCWQRFLVSHPCSQLQRVANMPPNALPFNCCQLCARTATESMQPCSICGLGSCKQCCFAADTCLHCTLQCSDLSPRMKYTWEIRVAHSKQQAAARIAGMARNGAILGQVHDTCQWFRESICLAGAGMARALWASHVSVSSTIP